MHWRKTLNTSFAFQHKNEGATPIVGQQIFTLDSMSVKDCSIF